MKIVEVYRMPTAVGHFNDSQVCVKFINDDGIVLEYTGDFKDGELSAYDEDGEVVIITNPDDIETIIAEKTEFVAIEDDKASKEEPARWGDGLYISKTNNPLTIYKDGRYLKYVPTETPGYYEVFDEDENRLESSYLRVVEVNATNEMFEKDEDDNEE